MSSVIPLEAEVDVTIGSQVVILEQFDEEFRNFLTSEFNIRNIDGVVSAEGNEFYLNEGNKSLTAEVRLDTATPCVIVTQNYQKEGELR